MQLPSFLRRPGAVAISVLAHAIVLAVLVDAAMSAAQEKPRTFDVSFVTPGLPAPRLPAPNLEDAKPPPPPDRPRHAPRPRRTNAPPTIEPLPLAPVEPVALASPEAPPEPREMTASAGAEPEYFALVSAALERRKRYPVDAKRRGFQGVVYVRFIIRRDGTLDGVMLERSSGNAALDKEAIALPERAAPFPPLPADFGERREVVVPVTFSLS